MICDISLGHTASATSVNINGWCPLFLWRREKEEALSVGSFWLTKCPKEARNAWRSSHHSNYLMVCLQVPWHETFVGELSGVQDKEQSNMCWRMAASLHDHEEDMPQEHLRRKLAAAVRSVQWSYAIFWARSSKQQGYVM